MNNTLRERNLYIVRIKHALELSVQIPIQAEEIIISGKGAKPHIDRAVAIADNKELWCRLSQDTIIISQRQQCLLCCIK